MLPVVKMLTRYGLTELCMRDFGVDKNLDCSISSLVRRKSREIKRTARDMLINVTVCPDVLDSHSKCKENKENKNVKRKLSDRNLYLPFPRKSRRTEASKELNVSIMCGQKFQTKPV